MHVSASLWCKWSRAVLRIHRVSALWSHLPVSVSLVILQTIQCVSTGNLGTSQILLGMPQEFQQNVEQCLTPTKCLRNVRYHHCPFRSTLLCLSPLLSTCHFPSCPSPRPFVPRMPSDAFPCHSSHMPNKSAQQMVLRLSYGIMRLRCREGNWHLNTVSSYYAN